MTGSQNRLLNITHGKYILIDLEADGKFKIPEQDLMELIHKVR
jgi:hypothetical protein